VGLSYKCADSLTIFTIGAVTSEGDYASFSSRGPTVDGRVKPDVMAQGQDAAVVDDNGNVTFNSGTSFSSPILAGSITCLWQSRPEIKNGRIMKIVRESAHLYDNPTDEMGYGIPNFEDAYNALQILGVEDQFFEQNFAIYPNPVADAFTISFPVSLEIAYLKIFNVQGNLLMEQTVSSSDNQVNITSLTSGMYIAILEAKEAYNSFKIIKE